MASPPFTCATCGKEFRKSSYLKRHIKLHSQEKPYKCFYCDKAFNRKSYARRHMVSHSKNNITSINCKAEGCPKMFKLERTMKRHYESAHVLHKCTFDGCEMAFNKKRKLQKHLHTHPGANVKAYRCTYDGCTYVAYGAKSHLLRHLANHEKVFKCSVLGCEETVKTWSAYKKHFETHKKIHCKECDIVCPDETAFKKHCKDAHHTSTSAVPCPYEGCSKSYSKRSNLNQHIRIAHVGRRFSCTVEGCDKIFRYNESLKEHIASHENPGKKTKRKRRRKSLAAKLSKYNGELCDLPVTYVDPKGDKPSTTFSVSDETPSQERCDVSTDFLSHKLDTEEEKSDEDTTKSIPDSLKERLQMIIKDSNHNINDSCSSESNSENKLTDESSHVLECSVAS